MYIGLALVGIFAIGITGGAALSGRKIAMLEAVVEKVTQKAADLEQIAITREIEAAGYKRKIEYLERHITEIQTIARKQDEELEKAANKDRSARGDMERARRIRAIEATTGELCTKLAELRHGCE